MIEFSAVEQGFESGLIDDRHIKPFSLCKLRPGGIAGDDPKGLKKALLLLPAASIVMLIVCLAL